MREDESLAVIRLSDGTILQRQSDGSFRPVPSLSDPARLALMSDDDLEWMASSDPDHPAVDDALLVAFARPARTSVRLDADLAAFFDADGTASERKINAVLRTFVEAHRKAG